MIKQPLDYLEGLGSVVRTICFDSTALDHIHYFWPLESWAMSPSEYISKSVYGLLFQPTALLLITVVIAHGLQNHRSSLTLYRESSSDDMTMYESVRASQSHTESHRTMSAMGLRGYIEVCLYLTTVGSGLTLHQEQ